LARHAEIKVVPQSMGPFFSMMFDPKGEDQKDFDADNNSWAVIEVGHFTTDFALIENGRTVEKGFGSCDGLRIAVEEFQKLYQKEHPQKGDVMFSAATAAMETKQVKFRGEVIDVSAEVRHSVVRLGDIIINRGNQFLGDRVNQLEGIKIAGGGAPLVFNALKKQWPHASLADNARHAVAEGFCRFALGLERHRAQEA
jgi:plasmid segregation protein ParM